MCSLRITSGQDQRPFSCHSCKYSAFQNCFFVYFQSTSSQQPSSTPGSQYPVQLVAKFTAFPAVSAPDPDRYSTPGGVGGNGYNSSRRTPLAVKSSPHKVPGSPDFRASGSRNISGAGSTGSGGSLVRNRCARIAKCSHVFPTFLHFTRFLLDNFLKILSPM